MSDTEEKRLLLKSAHLKGFKSIEDLTVEFRPGLNILIGKNGSGKSNLLEFLNISIDTIYSKVAPNFKFAELVISSTDNVNFSYRVEKKVAKMQPENDFFGDHLYSQRLKLDNNIVYDDLDENINNGTFDFRGRTFRTGRNLYSVFTKLGYGFFIPLHIQYSLPSKLSGVTDPGSIVMPIDTLMEWDINLANGFLYHSALIFNEALSERFFEMTDDDEDDIALKKVIDSLTVKSILDGIVLNQDIIDNLTLFSPIKDLRVSDNINLLKDEKNVSVNNLFLEFLVNEQWLPWSHLSDGTKRIFYIISEITNKRNGVILIEEPELGIHPSQFHLLMQFLKQESEYKQIIISTHSPKALDILQPDELDRIMIASYDKERGTQISRMDDQKIDKAQNYMKELFLSDFWLMSDLEDDD